MKKRFVKTFLTGCLLIIFGYSSELMSQNGSRSSYIDLTSAAEESVNAVVYIKTEFMQKTPTWDDFFGGTIWEHFFGMAPSTYPVQAAGSGVIVSSDGYIITNNHVVEDAVKTTITLNDKREYSGTIVGTDPSADLALIKIDATDLPYLTFANSDNIRLGEWVLAVGNPLNLNSTVTAGIISAKARQLELSSRSNRSNKSATEGSCFIQTDAAVNSGNSGGALVNAEGKLVGINTAIASGNGYYTGYSFAVPSNIVQKFYHDMKTYGQVQKAYLGISMMELDAKLAEEYELSNVKGIYVVELTENGAAAKGGLQEGDVILSIDNHDVNSLPEVQVVLKTKSPGDKVNITFERNNVTHNKVVTLLNEKGTTDLQNIE